LIEAGHHSFTENAATASTISSARKNKRAVRRAAEEQAGDNDTAKVIGGKTSMLVGLVNKAR
jgi:hypothetical protein